MQWFDVDKEGLGKLLERRGKEWVLFELIQNALDEETKEVDVTLERIAGTKYVNLVVRDDSPKGFSNLEHAFVLFAESGKKVDATKRGRFNMGEKAVLATCAEASIQSTTGTVVFDANGRRRTGKKTDRGSVFTGRMRMTNEEMAACGVAVKRLIVPRAVTLRFNGEEVAKREPIAMLQATMQTEVADAEGFLRRTMRVTTIGVYETLEGEEACLYEMGIPVVPTGDRWHCDVGQKVPLSMDRDSVPPTYLAKLRALVVDEMAERLVAEDSTSTWVKDAVQRFGEELRPETVTRLVELRFGEKSVIFDPSDQEANRIAVANGYSVVHGSQLSKQEWAAVRSAGALLPAGQVTPSPRPYSEGGKEQNILERSKWSPRMAGVEGLAKRLAKRLLGFEITVVMVSDVSWRFAGTYGGRTLTLNLGVLGHKWFDGPLAGILDLILHELSHEFESNHLSREYFAAITKLGGQMAVLALEEPELFSLEV